MIIIHPLIDPVIVSFGFLEIRWYSLAYVLGFLIGIYLIKKINSKFSIFNNDKIIDDFFVWSIIGVIIGGRLGYFIFYHTKIIFENPIQILLIWKGGMSFHGGLIGLILIIYFFSKLKSVDFFKISDLVTIVAPVGIFFGRIANFINTELNGRITDFPLAIIYPNIDNLPRHPSQIYEAIFEGLILFLILYISSNFNFHRMKYGLTTSLFLILYALFRFNLEFLREPDSHLGLFFNSLTMGQLLCVPMLIGGIFIYLFKKNGRNKKSYN